MPLFHVFTEQFRKRNPQREEPRIFIAAHPVPVSFELRNLTTSTLDQQISRYRQRATDSLAKFKTQANRLKDLKDKVRTLENDVNWGYKEYLRIVDIRNLYEKERRTREERKKREEEERRQQARRVQQRRERGRAGRNVNGGGLRR